MPRFCKVSYTIYICFCHWGLEASTTWIIRSAYLASSKVLRNASIRWWGSLRIKPTVSVSKISCPLSNFKFLVVGSNVANSLSSSNTLAFVRQFNNVDFPALVYPTIAATFTRLRLRCPLVTSLCCRTSDNSLFNWESLVLIKRRSISNFFSPGPLVPIPPPRRDSEIPNPVKRLKRYRSCANSTCIFPSLVEALAAKISKIISVRSITLQSNSRSMLRSCAGDNSSSQTIPVASNSTSIWRISCNFPVPT